MNARERQLWLWWGMLSAAFLALLGAGLFMTVRAAGQPRLAQVRAWFLPGETSYAHYQIELACEACHVRPFGGAALRQQACEGCHAAELKEAEDKHPLAKFTDPRNAPLLERIDATRCITCHTEHRPEITRAMGVTQPPDLCAHCHRDIAKERPSHAGFRFDSCSSSGCHRYHDNQATYEDFLLRHASEPQQLERVATRASNFAELAASLPDYPVQRYPLRVLVAGDADAPRAADGASTQQQDWAHSAHARNGVNCSACHQSAAAPGKWQKDPGDAPCAQCHRLQVQEFGRGHHGMRQAQGLPPMLPAQARLPMRDDAAGRALGCGSCHGAHRVDRIAAARDACLGCHADRHSLAFDASPHGRQWAEVRQGTRPAGEAVSCATCHMPVIALRDSELDVVFDHVQHNQSATLRPVDKMLRPACMRCHGLGFATDALADAALVQRNFTGRPAVHIDSIRMAQDRDAAIQRERRQQAAAAQGKAP
jgi:predicted CXXCH cytochrome family protein